MTATESALLLMLCLLLTCIVEGRKGNDNNYECLTNHFCGCGADDIAKYRECWDKLEEATIDYAIEKVKKLEMCKGFNGEMQKMSFEEYLTFYCALPPDDQKECYDDINKELMNRTKELFMSIGEQDRKEREGLENCGMCVQPYVMSCRDSMSKCL